jgi:hypothetical protein
MELIYQDKLDLLAAADFTSRFYAHVNGDAPTELAFQERCRTLADKVRQSMMWLVTEELEGHHPIHKDYPLLPGDVLVPREDGTYGKLTGLGIEGFRLTAEQAKTLVPTDGTIVMEVSLP